MAGVEQEVAVGEQPQVVAARGRVFPLDLDGQAGIQELAGNATLLYYMTGEAREFHQAQREKRRPDARKHPWLP